MRGARIAFMRMVGTPEEVVAGAKGSQYWPAMEALAHTLAYDAALVEALGEVDSSSPPRTQSAGGLADTPKPSSFERRSDRPEPSCSVPFVASPVVRGTDAEVISLVEAAGRASTWALVQYTRTTSGRVSTPHQGADTGWAMSLRSAA
jgi:hypothetical protein